MDTLERLKSSGRTTRMILRAAALASKGRTVVIVSADHNHAQVLFDMTAGIVERLTPSWMSYRGSKCQRKLDVKGGPFGDGTIRVCVDIDEAEVDWQSMQVRVMGKPHDVAFVDHYTIERRFERMIRAFHQFDP